MLQNSLNVVQIIVGITLIVLIMLEVQSSGAGGVFGGTQTSLIRKRRGPELLIFQLTIGTSLLFFIIAIINVLVVG